MCIKPFNQARSIGYMLSKIQKETKDNQITINVIIK